MILCENVWVQYRRKTRLRQALKNTAIQLFRQKVETVDFWGLQDISFKVSEGEVMGVVGVNGSGKTTLLKVLCEVLKPDRGRVKLEGRICPLLEVGTGFEAELSGSENIFLNGSVLGIRKQDLKNRFDQIVEFAGLDEFIDTPLKHYSTGMRMRLGFSIATHGDPEVLLIDEVLAVGDLAFQKKCIDKIHELRERGITILFVSHTMDTIKHLCTSAIWLDHGLAKAQGEVERVVNSYLQDSDRREKEDMEKHWNRFQHVDSQASNIPVVGIRGVQFYNGKREASTLFQPFDPLIAAIHFTAREKIRDPIFGIAIHRLDGIHICGPNTGECDYRIDSIEGEGIIEFRIPSLKLLSGVYLMTVGIFDSSHIHSYDYRERAFRFEVEFSSMKGHRGLVAMDYEWRRVTPSGE